MAKGEHATLAVSGAEFTVRATPRAKKTGLLYADGVFKIMVSAPAEDGKANLAVAEALAHSLGVARTRLTLLRGATARDKIFRLD